MILVLSTKSCSSFHPENPASDIYSYLNDSIGFADRVEERFGGIDVWVSNAGIFPAKRIVEASEELWQTTLDINMKSVYYGGIIAADKLRKRGGGVLINAASFASLMS